MWMEETIGERVNNNRVAAVLARGRVGSNPHGGNGNGPDGDVEAAAAPTEGASDH